MSGSNNVGCSANIFGVWMLMFIVIKVGGHAFAAWSWWWLLLPIVPDLVLILTKFGLMA